MRWLANRHSHLPISNFWQFRIGDKVWGKMTDNAGLWQAKQENSGKGLLLNLKRMAGHKHRDLMRVFSVGLGFWMLLVFSTAS
jgi:hypothetical protein